MATTRQKTGARELTVTHTNVTVHNLDDMEARLATLESELAGDLPGDFVLFTKGEIQAAKRAPDLGKRFADKLVTDNQERLDRQGERDSLVSQIRAVTDELAGL